MSNETLNTIDPTKNDKHTGDTSNEKYRMSDVLRRVIYSTLTKEDADDIIGVVEDEPVSNDKNIYDFDNLMRKLKEREMKLLVKLNEKKDTINNLG